LIIAKGLQNSIADYLSEGNGQGRLDEKSDELKGPNERYHHKITSPDVGLSPLSRIRKFSGLVSGFAGQLNDCESGAPNRQKRGESLAGLTSFATFTGF